jgi:hypothetical protein
MDKGMGRSKEPVAASALPARSLPPTQTQQEFDGVVRDGVVHLNGTLPEGTRVQVRVKK